MTKADTLLFLRKKLKKSQIESISIFTFSQWNMYSDSVIREIFEKFSPCKVVIRSSAINEDTEECSQAGRFHSELDVDSSYPTIIRKAIDKVVKSYKSKNGNNQILVQDQTQDIAMSGVVFTRQIGTNAPYYIINYDDVSGETNTVTGGRSGIATCVFRLVDISKDNKWYSFVEAIKEIEECLNNRLLDIEFAIKKDGTVVIFQARWLSANWGISVPQDDKIKTLVGNMKSKFKRLSISSPHILGKETLFCDMSDWNPSEMIGVAPNTLDYSLYEYLFTDSVWYEARSYLGYRNVAPAELMVSFGRKPFIDVRLSFNSLLPSDLPEPLASKIVDYYIDELKQCPEKQDKIEFEIAWTCFDFSTENELSKLKKYGFDNSDIILFKNHLKKITNRLLKNGDNIIKQNLSIVQELTRRKNVLLKSHSRKTTWDMLSLAYGLMQNCKRLGALPFAILARLAFIGSNFLDSMEKKRIISKTDRENFMCLLNTVATEFSRDLTLFECGNMQKKSFFEKYGHLRPCTYDITAPRYDQMQEVFKKSGTNIINIHRTQKNFSNKIMEEIETQLIKYGLQVSPLLFVKFISQAIKARELAKFEFTKTLSDAMEIIAQVAEKMGIDREDIAKMDFLSLIKFRNYEQMDSKTAIYSIKENISRHKAERKMYEYLIIPPIISSEKDFDIVKYYEARPNFVTDKKVKAETVFLCRSKPLKVDMVKNHIVMIESADPGFDWIFTKNPTGIVTKYGGANSHMTIRCAELGIPAAIGCGTIIFDRLLKSKLVLLDCDKGAIEGVI